MTLNTSAGAGETPSEVRGIQAALRIMTRWGLTPEVQSRILGPDATKLGFSEPMPKLSSDQLTKLSLILNIHASLRELFSNPENPVRFMNAANHNAPFFSKTPLMLIESGKTSDLQRLLDHLYQLQNGNW